VILIITSLVAPYDYRAYAESEENYPTIKIGVYAIEEYQDGCYPSDLCQIRTVPPYCYLDVLDCYKVINDCRALRPENLKRAIEAAMAFKKILVGENKDCTIMNYVVGSRSISIRVCVYVFVNSQVNSSVFTDPNAPNSISNYDIVIFIGHGVRRGIIPYDWYDRWKKLNRTYISLWEIEGARNRTKWIFLYSCNSLDIFYACNTKGECPDNPSEVAKQHYNNEIPRNIKEGLFGFDPSNISSLTQISLGGVAGFYTKTYAVCSGSNAAKDALEEFAKRIKSGAYLELAWYRLSDAWKGGCSPWFQAKTSSLYMRIYVYNNRNEIVGIYDPDGNLALIIEKGSPRDAYFKYKNTGYRLVVSFVYRVYGGFILEDPPRIVNGRYVVNQNTAGGGGGVWRWRFSSLPRILPI